MIQKLGQKSTYDEEPTYFKFVLLVDHKEVDNYLPSRKVMYKKEK